MFKFASCIIGAGLMFGASAASAGDLPRDVIDGVMTTCRLDYHRICSLVVPGEGRVARCLLDHETQLAPSCLSALKLAYAIEACSPDYHRYCDGVPRGPEALECLADRIESLRPECRSVVAANAPYMENREDRYSYNHNRSPYAEDHAYSERPAGEDRYTDREEPRHRSYDNRGYAEQDEQYSRPYDRGEDEERDPAK